MLQRVENDARSILNWYTFYRVGVSLREKDKKMLWSVKKGLVPCWVGVCFEHHVFASWMICSVGNLRPSLVVVH